MPLSSFRLPSQIIYFSTAKPAEKLNQGWDQKASDIVAKSLYTDSEVFLRELLSKCFRCSGKKEDFLTQANEDLAVHINIEATKNQLIL